LFVARLYLGLDIKFKPNLVAAGGRHEFDRLICALNSGLNLIHLNLRPNLTSLSQLVNSLLKTGLNLRVVICFALRGCPRPLKFSEFNAKSVFSPALAFFVCRLKFHKRKSVAKAACIAIFGICGFIAALFYDKGKR